MSSDCVKTDVGRSDGREENSSIVKTAQVCLQARLVLNYSLFFICNIESKSETEFVFDEKAPRISVHFVPLSSLTHRLISVN